jgi:hypothetical protein
MPHGHLVHAREIGQVRIYLQPRERGSQGGRGLKKLLGTPPLYKEIIREAQRDGLLNATAHHTHYGFSGNGALQGAGDEIPNPLLTLCVELIGPRDELERFCRRHGELLKGKVIVYKHMEHWEISSNRLRTSEAAATEYAEPEPGPGEET